MGEEEERRRRRRRRRRARRKNEDEEETRTRMKTKTRKRKEGRKEVPRVHTHHMLVQKNVRICSICGSRGSQAIPTTSGKKEKVDTLLSFLM
jgi:sRNA-binding protein